MGEPAAGEQARRAELAANVAEFRDRVDAACAGSDRDPAEITLIAVTKTFPASDVRLLAELGITDVGENRDQEASPKHEHTADLALRWHFVGRLQRNKCRSVAGYADVVHSVDRPELVEALSAAALVAGRDLSALVQVSLDTDHAARRGGVAPAEVVPLAEQVMGAAGLTLAGVMAVAPLDADPDEAFARLARISERVRATDRAATVVSAGMSGDFEAAIRHGATHLRVGTALLGRRSTPVG